jgi:hypothetical protein
MALVSHKLKTIFIAVPKTGSTSVMRSVQDTDAEAELGDRHEKAPLARYRLGEEMWRAYRKVGFVRHPMKWVASYYRFLSGNMPISDLDKFVLWTPTPYDWFTDATGNLLVDKIYRTEDMDAVVAELGLETVHHVNQGMNKQITVDLNEAHDGIIRQKFVREYAHYT